MPRERAARKTELEAPRTGDGKTPAWYLWFQQGRMPDTRHFCCICGRKGLTLSEAGKAMFSGIIDAAFSFADEDREIGAGDVARRAAPAIGRVGGLILMPAVIDLGTRGDGMDIMRFFGRRPMFVCTECGGAEALARYLAEGF